MGMMRRTDCHKAQRRRADIGAIAHQLHMVGSNMVAAGFETMPIGHREARHMAAVTGVDTRLHFGGEMVGHGLITLG